MAVLEILKSTMRTRDYIETRRQAKASRCSTRCATASSTACSTSTARSRSWCAPASITSSTGLLYATNAGNLRVQLADVVDDEVEEGTLVHY